MLPLGLIVSSITGIFSPEQKSIKISFFFGSGFSFLLEFPAWHTMSTPFLASFLDFLANLTEFLTSRQLCSVMTGIKSP